MQNNEHILRDGDIIRLDQMMPDQRELYDLQRRIFTWSHDPISEFAIATGSEQLLECAAKYLPEICRTAYLIGRLGGFWMGPKEMGKHYLDLMDVNQGVVWKSFISHYNPTQLPVRKGSTDETVHHRQDQG
jgi:hypothetical protein